MSIKCLPISRGRFCMAGFFQEIKMGVVTFFRGPQIKSPFLRHQCDVIRESNMNHDSYYDFAAGFPDKAMTVDTTFGNTIVHEFFLPEEHVKVQLCESKG